MDEKSSINSISEKATEHAIKVLNYWHRMEFFVSTDIKALEDGTEGTLRLTKDELKDPSCLPWINREQIRRAGENFSPEKKYSYTLYFGIFSRNEIFNRAKRIYPEIANGKIEDPNQDDGRTCSITLIVDSNGEAKRDSFEFSTVTWALGQLEKNGLNGIQLSDYELQTDKLQQHFLDIMTTADNLKNQYELAPAITTFEIIEFLKSMAEWTDFSPELPAPALYIKLKEIKTKKPINLENKLDDKQLYNLKELSLTLESKNKENITAAITNKNEITILNSFYIRDIERVINAIKINRIDLSSPLGQYLCSSGKKKTDLLKPEGKSQLINMLKLSKLPAGRWPAETSHAMSLMQQFAINAIENGLKHCGLYSVNGPPGTGKTTMLRDLIASNIVKRAEVLSSLSKATDAFGEEISVSLGQKTYPVLCLLPQLTGFEMVVVSSNNAAVENISQELPQKKSLGKSWQDINYLKPVAQKLAAQDIPLEEGEYVEEQKKGKKYKIEPLHSQNDCWGLIAAALGKQGNRDIFSRRMFFQPIEKCITTAPADLYRTLTEAIKQSRAPSFIDAKSDFLDAQQHFQDLINELSKLEELAEDEIKYEKQQRELDKIRFRLLRLDSRLAKLEEERTSLWHFNIKKYCRIRVIKKALILRKKTAQSKLNAEQYKWEKLSSLIIKNRDLYQSFKTKFAGVIFPTYNTDLEDPMIQRTAFGQCSILNNARTNLTVKAFELHEAWLVSAYDYRFSQSLFILKDVINGNIRDKKAAKALWNLLFMIVPVISSTFASVARQFNALDEKDIGWLFIDEAGQATPQQAIGALWRAKRTVVVGDPLQIEPVFTVPSAFVETIAKREFDEQWHDWSPTTQSVQSLADRANPYGTDQIAKGTWLGSPLRVHRRCDEPMFSIANTIAYNKKMLHGRDNIKIEDDFLWGPSCWFDIEGNTKGKHFVPEQAHHVLSMLTKYIEYYKKLPDAYIISPFKQVKDELNQFLKTKLPNIEGRDKWLKERIGTVHTFQGKEEKNVILILGLSGKNTGAAQWASSKPNILNVAVTRAQKRIYIIGSQNIWSGCKFFAVAHEMLAQEKSASTSIPTKDLINI